jgi:hypothetical protein
MPLLTRAFRAPAPFRTWAGIQEAAGTSRPVKRRSNFEEANYCLHSCGSIWQKDFFFDQNRAQAIDVFGGPGTWLK